MNSDLEGVMRRVQKLLAIAQDSRANPNEAAAAAQQAEKVMRHYQVTHADILARQFASKASRADFAYFDAKAGMRGDRAKVKLQRVPGWCGWMAYAVAKLNDCEIRYANTSEFGVVVRFYGYRADAQVAEWTYAYLIDATTRALRDWQREALRTKAESESYRRGFALAVCKIINNEAAAKRREMEAASASRALVLLKAQAVAEHFGTFNYGAGKSSTISSGSAYAAGREAGSKVQLRAGLGSSGSGTTRSLK